MKLLSNHFFKVLFVLCCLAIFVGSLVPGKLLPTDLIWDKAGHFIAYFGLAFLCRVASKRHQTWQLFIACLLFSLLIEVAQKFIPNRAFEWLDLWANGLGIAVGLSIAILCNLLIFKDKSTKK